MWGEVEPLGNLLVGESLAQAMQDVPLPGSEGRGRAGAVTFPLPVQAGDLAPVGLQRSGQGKQRAYARIVLCEGHVYPVRRGNIRTKGKLHGLL